jgi:hypothetical protein
MPVDTTEGVVTLAVTLRGVERHFVVSALLVCTLTSDEAKKCNMATWGRGEMVKKVAVGW